MTPSKPRPASAALPSQMQGIAQAVAQSEPLANLARRLRQSRDRYLAIAPMLPPALRSHVRAGPIDEQGWVLLAANQAVSAKLRQMLPSLQNTLQQQGWPALPITVRLAPAG